MKIKVKSGDGFSFDIQAGPNDLVADVKWNIWKKCQQTLYRVEDQMLKYEGKILKDDTTLKDNNIHDNCSIFLMRVVPAKPSRVSSTTTSTTTVVPSSNSVPPSSTNPDSTPSPLTTVTANLDVANLPLIKRALRRIDVDHSSCDAFENTIKRALLYQATAVPSHARDSPVVSQLAQLAAVQASQHTQIAGGASQPTPLAPEGIPTLASALAQSEAVQASQHAQTAAEASQPTPPAPKGIPTHQRVLAQIAAVQASQLAQATAGASQPTTPAHKGIPTLASVLAQSEAVQASQHAQTAAEVSQPTLLAPEVSGRNATPLNLFPQNV